MSESENLPFNFGGLNEAMADFDHAKVLIWPVPFEKTVSYGVGTKDGPHAIIEASRNVELYDEEVGGECPPDLYRAQQAAGGVNGFAGVDADQIALFHEQGYLVVHDAFTGTEVADALAGLLDLIGGTYPAIV